MDLVGTRTALHGVAELLVAGPQYYAAGTVRLRVLPGGFGTVTGPPVRVEGVELVAPGGRCPLAGTFAEVGAAVGLVPRRLDDVYAGGPGLGPGDRLDLDPSAVTRLCDALSVGDAALRAFAPDETPVLWPEHFDVAISVGEVNVGVSPGDEHVAEPYAYVGPWSPPPVGGFWNQPFGASRPLADLVDVAAVVAFFAEGRDLAAAPSPGGAAAPGLGGCRFHRLSGDVGTWWPKLRPTSAGFTA
ncbi:MAG: hypothetical protein U0R80_05645 [Nocardioidaceae bacterium]